MFRLSRNMLEKNTRGDNDSDGNRRWAEFSAGVFTMEPAKGVIRRYHLHRKLFLPCQLGGPSFSHKYRRICILKKITKTSFQKGKNKQKCLRMILIFFSSIEKLMYLNPKLAIIEVR